MEVLEIISKIMLVIATAFVIFRLIELHNVLDKKYEALFDILNDKINHLERRVYELERSNESAHTHLSQKE